MPAQNGRHEACPGLPYIAIGTARLPTAASEDQTRILTIELTVNHMDGQIVDVASTIPLPGYIALLRRLLEGLSIDQVEEAAQHLEEHLGGPLLRPTIAALQKAVAASTNRTAAV